MCLFPVTNSVVMVNTFEKFYDYEGTTWKWNDIWLKVKEHARWKSAKARLIQKEKLLKAQKSIQSDDDYCDDAPEEVAKRKEQRDIGRKQAKSKKAYEKQNAAAITQTNETFDKFVSGFEGRMSVKTEHDRAKLSLFAERTNTNVARVKAKANKEKRKLMELEERYGNLRYESFYSKWL